MNIKNFFLGLLATGTLISCQSTGSVNIETKADTVSYVIGAGSGQRLASDFEQRGMDTVVNLELFFQGIVDGSSEKELKYDIKANGSKVQTFFQQMQMQQTKLRMDTTGTAQPFSPEAGLVDTVSYVFGAQNGEGMRKGFMDAGMDTVLNFDLYIQALLTTGKGGEAIISIEDNRKMVDAFFAELEESKLMAEFGEVKAASEEYLAKNKGLETVTTTESGLQYEVLVEGNGPKPNKTDRVKVHYHGTLIDGTVFDSSVDRGEPATFGVGQVIKGWTEALQLMPVGSKWKVTIPYDLGYGTRPHPGGKIRPFDALIFEVELIEIVNK